MLKQKAIILSSIQGTGKALLSIDDFRRYNCSIGETVCVTLNDESYLCEAQIMDRLQHTDIFFDNLVRLPRRFSHTEDCIEKMSKTIHAAKQLQVQITISNNSFINQTVQERWKLKNLVLNRVLAVGCCINYNSPLFNKVEVLTTDPEGFVQVVRSTVVQIVYQHKNSTHEISSLPKYPILGGLEEVKQSLYNMLSLPFTHSEVFTHLQVESPKGILLKGPPGVGKTMLVNYVAAETSAKLFVINGPEVYGQYVGESEKRLRQVFLDAHDHFGPAIIFIDEIDALCPKRTDVQSQESRVVAQLLTLMDGLNSRGRVVVVAATNRANSIDPALRRPGRFDREVEIPIPNSKERSEILQVHLQGLPICGELNLDSLSSLLPGYVGADIAALCREAAMMAMQNTNFKEITMDHFVHALGVVGPSVHRGSSIDFKKTSWQDIGGLDHIKKRLIQAVEWPLKYPTSFARLGLAPPKGVLLWGPPGCSKTTLAKAIATSTNVNFFAVNGAAVYSPYLGDAEAAIRETFKKARLASPSIIFLDEIDAIVGKRSFDADQSPSEGVQERVLATLLNEMDGIEQNLNVLVLAATNRPDMLDIALLRPGRIDTVLFVPPPDTAGRKQILEVHTKDMPLGNDVNLAELARLTEHFTGADVENLCREAALLALREDINCRFVTMSHFLKAKEVTRATMLDYTIESTLFQQIQE